TTGQLQRVTRETPHEETGENEVQLLLEIGGIFADFTNGADLGGTRALKANDALASRGMMLGGSGFIVSSKEAKFLGLGEVSGLENYIRPYRNGRDLVNAPRGVMVIDLFGI